MEPDILASPGPEAASGPDWPTPVNHPARDSHTLDATPQTGQARPSLSAGAPAAGGERPRLATGTTTHPHGFANGHARPRTTARGAWANGGHGSSAVTLTPAIPFETPEPRGSRKSALAERRPMRWPFRALLRKSGLPRRCLDGAGLAPRGNPSNQPQAGKSSFQVTDFIAAELLKALERAQS